MAASFGEQLKAAREAQSITLREVSEQTRISLRYLEALEADDFKVLPGGVFNRSFIRTYAKYIGFDENEAIRLYQIGSNAPSPEEEAEIALPRHKVYTDDSVARSPLTNLLLVGGALLLLAAGMYGFLRWYQQPPAPAVATNPTPTPAPAASSPTPTISAPTPAPGASPVTAAASPSASPGATPAPSAPTPPPSGSFSVQVRAKDKPVIVATGVDGSKLELIKLNAGETRDFTPQQAVAVQYQAPGGELLEIFVNGQQINLAQFPGSGKFKQVDFTIDRNDYQKFLQATQPAPTPAQ
jgi:cytoskeleton protein RodZ